MRIRVRIVSIIVRVFKFFNIYIYIYIYTGQVWVECGGSGLGLVCIIPTLNPNPLRVGFLKPKPAPFASRVE